MKYLKLTVLLIFLSVSFSFAQNKITGRILDDKNQPIPYATVTALKPDSTIVGGDLTNENGSFALSNLSLGHFILRINILGFKQRFIDNISLTQQAPNKSLGNIVIRPDAHKLKEVEITGERALMELSVDKKVFNVDKNITSSGGSAADALKNVPSLQVDIDGTILLRGKDANILIDGKPATLLGGDVATALQALPASSIQSVEVITNPSAKYDAQGMAGIINIITKRDSKLGFNGNASVGAGTRDKYNASVALNLKNDKWNIFFNSNWRNNKTYEHTANRRMMADGTLTAASYEDNIRTRGGWFNSLGAEYTINSRNTITLTQNLNQMLWASNGNTMYTYNQGPIIDSSTTRGTVNTGSPLSSSTSLDFKHKFLKPKQELNSSITYVNTRVNRDQEYITNRFDAMDAPIGNTIIQRAPGGGTSSSLNAQADFTTPFLTKNGKLDAGWKTQIYWFKSNNEARVDSNNGKGFVPDMVLQNDYQYSQQVHAVYASYSDQRGKFGYQIGLRGEYSYYDGTSSRIVSGLRYNNQFLNLFPSLYLSYKLPKDQAVYLSYSRRINRPSFFQMMPFIDVSNPMDTSAGNPNLIPEFIHNIELNYSRQFKQGHMIIASLYYQYTQNLIDRISTFYNDGTSFTKPQNLNKGITYGAELTGRAQILPIWNATVNFNLFQNQIFGATATNTLDNSGVSWFTKFNTDVKLPYNFSFQLSGTYQAPKVAAQGIIQDVWWVDAALRKTFWNNKANLVLNISDIFNSRKYTTIYDFPGAVQSIYRDRETRIGNLTFSYRFGKSDVKTSSKRGRGDKDKNMQPQSKEHDNIKQGEGGDDSGS
ncbi:MAG: TonB-dependent receptor [Bacteroidetes bacterium]|nr:TonB-dependent receptor [Bacteroidota bacterium]